MLTCEMPMFNWHPHNLAPKPWPARSSVTWGGHKGYMGWLKWIWAYLFDCVHAHTTWPHRDQRGFTYVACLDCGRELPYSLESMRILTGEEQFRDRKQTTWGAGSRAAASLVLVAVLVCLNSHRAIAQATEGSTSQAKTTAVTVENTPILVIGFVGGYVHSDDLRHSEVQLARKIGAAYGDRVKVDVFKNRQKSKARMAVVGWVNAFKTQTGASQPRIILFGHSWGASALVYLARELEREGVPVALTIQVDSVRKHHQDDSVIPANVAEAINFYQSRGIIHGRSMIVAADASRTTILGNLRFEYDKEPAECRAYPWYDRVFFKGHTSIECDPHVWSQVEQLIEARVSTTARQGEVARNSETR